MEFFKLANSSTEISRFVFGCEPLGGADWGQFDLNKTIDAARTAYDLGVNAFDVADIYGLGRAEEALAKALGSRIKNAIVITKFGLRWETPLGSERAPVVKDSSVGWIRKALEDSLTRLGLDCIPVYLVHWPDPATSLEETFSELARLQQEGKIKHIGVSNFSPTELKLATKFANISLVESNASLLNFKEIRANLRAYRQLGVSSLAYGTLAQGFLTLKFDRAAHFEVDDRRHRLPQFVAGGWETYQELVKRVDRLSKDLDRTPAQIAIRWCLDQPELDGVIVGLKTSQQLESNLGSLGWSLSAEHINYLEQGL